MNKTCCVPALVIPHAVKAGHCISTHVYSISYVSTNIDTKLTQLLITGLEKEIWVLLSLINTLERWLQSLNRSL